MNAIIIKENLRGLVVKKTLLGSHDDAFPKTTPFVTFNTETNEKGNGLHYSIDIITLLPETPTKDDFDVYATSSKQEIRVKDRLLPVFMREIIINFDAHNTKTKLYIWHINVSYVLDAPRDDSDNVLFVKYSNGAKPHSDPDTTRGTVTTSGIPNP